MVFFIKLILILLTVFLLQITFIGYLQEFYININLIFLTVAFYPIFFGFKKAIFSAGILGILRDSVSANTFGIYLFSCLTISILINIIRDRFYKEAIISQLFLILITFIFFKFIHICLIWLFSSTTFPNMVLYSKLLLSLTWTTILSPIIFYILRKIHGYEQ